MDVRAEPARATLLDVLRLRALEDPGGWALTFLADGERDEARLSYAELDERARAIAALLRERLPEQGSALLLHPPGLDYVAALVGCLYAGAVAVPTAPPGSRRGLERLLAIAADAQADVALTSAPAASDLRRALGAAPDVRFPPLLAT